MLEFVGSVSLEFDSKEVEVIAFSVRVSTGRKPIVVISRKSGSGFANGVTVYELSITVAMPLGDESIEWENIRKGKLTVDPLNGGKRYSYRDCCCIDVSETYKLDGEAVKDIKLMSFDKFSE